MIIDSWSIFFVRCNVNISDYKIIRYLYGKGKKSRVIILCYINLKWNIGLNKNLKL